MAEVRQTRQPSALAAPASVRLFLRRLRVERQLALVLLLVVLLTAVLFAAIPRFYNRMSDEGLAHELRSARPALANVQMLEQTFPFAGPGMLATDEITEHGAELEQQLPSALTSLFERRDYVAQSAEYHVELGEGAPAWPQYFFKGRLQSGIEHHVRIAEGRLPLATDETVPVEAFVIDPNTGEPTQEKQEVPAPVIEVAISSAAATTAGWHVGDRIENSLIDLPSLVIDGAAPAGSGRIFVDIVGRFDVPDPSEDYWYDDVLLQRANITGSVDHPEIHVIGLLADDGYEKLVAEQNVVFEYRWQYFIDPDRLTADELPVVQAAVKKVRTDYPAFVNRFGGDPALRTGLDSIFQRFQGQLRLTQAMLAVVTMGLLAVAMVVVGLIGALIADRRRSALVLQRGRGASAWQILGAQLGEGLLLTIPAVAIGGILAIVLLPARGTTWSALAVIAVASGATLLLMAIALPVARGRLGQLERSDASLSRVSVRRLVFEALVVVLAVGGVYLLRRRGLGGEAGSSGFDPFLAAVPVLAGLAAGLVVLRLYPLPIRFFAWLASLGRGFVSVFALRRVGRQPGAGNLPLLVLLLTVAVGVFSSVLLTTIERGQSATAWQEIGAPYRAQVTFGELPDDLDLASIPGVEAAARSYFAPGITFDMSGSTNLVTLDAVEAPQLESVTAGTPADPHLPPGLMDEPGAGNAGTEQAPIPAIISSRAATGPRPMQMDDRFQLLIEGTWIQFVVVDVRDTMPGIVPGTLFVVTSFDQLAVARSSAPLPVTNVFVRAPAAAEPALRSAVDAVTPQTNLVSQAAALGALQGSPLIAGVATGFRASLLVAALYSALAVIVALTLSAAARARDLAFLRTLGLTRSQAVGLMVVEQVPGVVVALVAGVGLGIAVAALIEPGLDLKAFTGATIPVVLRVDWPAVILIGLGLAAVVAVAVALTALLNRRRNLGTALRVGE
jgi:putative ABC transport system permease protein